MKGKLITLKHHADDYESTGNEKNICEITAIKNGNIIYKDYWHGYRRGDTHA